MHVKRYRINPINMVSFITLGMIKINTLLYLLYISKMTLDAVFFQSR